MKTVFNWFYFNKKRAALLTIAWAACILVACLIPGKEVPSFKFLEYDKLLHFCIFALLSFLWLCSLTAPRAQSQGVLIVTACILYGYLVEALQGSGLVAGRSFDHYDALADALGSVFGVAAFFLAKRYFSHA